MRRRWFISLCVVCLFLTSGLMPGYAQDRVPKLAASVSQNTSVWQALVFWQEELTTAGREQFVVQVFPDSQLGSEDTVLAGVRFGQIEMALLSVDALLTLSPELGVIAAPGFFRDELHRSNVLHGPVGKRLLASFSRYRMLGIGFFDAEPQGIFSFQEPLLTSQAMQDVPIGVMAENCDGDSAEQQDMSFAEQLEGLVLLGAQRVPLCAEQQAQSIASGDVAAWKGPLSDWSNLASIVADMPSVAVFQHFDHPYVLVAGTVWFNALDPDEQALLMNTTRLATLYQQQVADERLQQDITQMQAAGMQVELYHANFLSEAAQSRYERLVAESGENIDELLQAIERVK